MTNFKSNPEAAAKLKAMFTEMHELCVENNIAYVAAACIEDNEQSAGISLSAYVEHDKTALPNSIIAAVEIIKMDYVPDSFVAALIEGNRNGGECDCEECRANRAAQAH